MTLDPWYVTLAPAFQRLDAWIENEGFRGWDPYDALNSPLLRRLTFGSRRLGQLWVQLFKLSPVNLRPLFGVPKGYNPKGMGLFLASYWRKYLLGGEARHLQQTRFFARWLLDNHSKGFHGLSWGYNFPWPNRGFFAPAGMPTIVNTAFIGLAFLDLIRLEGTSSSPGQPTDWGFSPLETARAACEFILLDLNRTEPAADELCFSYTPLDHRFVHNANLMGAWLLAETAALTGEDPLIDAAARAARYTVRRQGADGSWKYGEGPGDGWVDNFHTGFVLTALKRILELRPEAGPGESLEWGYLYWKRVFSLPNGAPKYFPQKTWPIDIHACAQSALTFLAFSDQDSQAQDLARRSLDWAMERMQDRGGFFYFQRRPAWTIRIPYLRWSQAWMQRAFVELEWRAARIARQ